MACLEFTSDDQVPVIKKFFYDRAVKDKLFYEELSNQRVIFATETEVQKWARSNPKVTEIKQKFGNLMKEHKMGLHPLYAYIDKDQSQSISQEEFR